MVQSAVTQVVRTLNDVHGLFGLSRSDDAQFFSEWQETLPALNDLERASLDRVRKRFRYHREAGQVTEGMVNAIVVSPLLELVGFYDPPFRLRSEMTVEVQAKQEQRLLRGRVDFLVVQDLFWQVVIESKETTFDVEVGIPQLLAYMMAAPMSQEVLFGMVTNGNSFVFVKLRRGEKPVYDFSDVYSMLTRENQLYAVAQVLNRIAGEMPED